MRPSQKQTKVQENNEIFKPEQKGGNSSIKKNCKSKCKSKIIKKEENQIKKKKQVNFNKIKKKKEIQLKKRGKIFKRNLKKAIKKYRKLLGPALECRLLKHVAQLQEDIKNNYSYLKFGQREDSLIKLQYKIIQDIKELFVTLAALIQEKIQMRVDKFTHKIRIYVNFFDTIVNLAKQNLPEIQHDYIQTCCKWQWKIAPKYQLHDKIKFQPHTNIGVFNERDMTCILVNLIILRFHFKTKEDKDKDILNKVVIQFKMIYRTFLKCLVSALTLLPLQYPQFQKHMRILMEESLENANKIQEILVLILLTGDLQAAIDTLYQYPYSCSMKINFWANLQLFMKFGQAQKQIMSLYCRQGKPKCSINLEAQEKENEAFNKNLVKMEHMVKLEHIHEAQNKEIGALSSNLVKMEYIYETQEKEDGALNQNLVKLEHIYEAQEKEIEALNQYLVKLKHISKEHSNKQPQNQEQNQMLNEEGSKQQQIKENQDKQANIKTAQKKKFSQEDHQQENRE